MSLPGFFTSVATRPFRTPVVAVSVAGTLAVVIALNTAVCAVIQAVWFKALPFGKVDQLVVVGRTHATGSPTLPGPISIPEFFDWRERSREFDGLAAASLRNGTMSAEGPGGVRAIDVAVVTPNLFSLLGVRASVGRSFDASDVRSGDAEPIVLGHAFWQQVFQGDSDVVGKTIRLASFDASKEYEVTGVMPKEFQIRFPTAHDAYIAAPTVTVDRAGTARGAAVYTVFGRVRAGRSIDGVKSAMRALGETLNREYPTSSQNTAVGVVPVSEFFLGRTRPLLMALAGAAAFILLLACANISSILLSTTLDRSGELATRAALGAARWRLTAMLIGEHASLGAVGSLAGLALASAAVGALRHIAPAELPRIDTLAIDWPVVAVSIAVAAVATVASALFPAWRFGRVDPADELRSAGRTRNPETRRAQRILLTSQIALVVLLLLGAGLMLASLRGLLKVELGFKPEGLIALRARFLLPNYGPAGVVLQDRLMHEVSGKAGVVSAGWTSEVPLGPPNLVRLKLRSIGDITPRYRIVSAGYLETVGASLIRGRLFENSDRDGAPVTVVNRSFVERYFGDRDPIGEEVFIREWHRIIGVVNDVREGPLEDVDTPTIYWLFSGRNWMAGAPWFVIRVRDAKSTNPETLRAVVESVDPSLPVLATERSIDRVIQHTARTRFLSAILGGIAAVALLIAAAGVFGITAYSVRQRTQEFGLRMALGAGQGDVAWQVLKGTATIAGIGIASGLILSWIVNRWIRAFLFGVGPNDPGVTMAIVAVLLLVIVASCLVPLRRALFIEPAEALRHQ